MRITVGHVLIVALLGGGVYYDIRSSDSYLKQFGDAAKAEFQSLVSLATGEEVPVKRAVAPKPALRPSPAVPDAEPKPVPPLAKVGKEQSQAKPAKVVPAPVSKESAKKTVRKNIKKKSKVSARAGKWKKQTVKKKTSKKRKSTARKSKKSKPSGGVEKLVGTYVAMELKTGRTVRGIFEGKSPTHYTLQLPGMGPFKYAVADVKKVEPVK